MNTQIMTRKILYAILIGTVLFSCGIKKMSNDEIAQTTEILVAKNKANKTLKKETTEGALTDKDGYNDIGKFKYSVYYDETSKALYRIENIEMTDVTLTETYYFKDNDLYFIETLESSAAEKAIYTKGFELLMKKNASDAETKLLINKAKRFKTAFKK